MLGGEGNGGLTFIRSSNLARGTAILTACCVWAPLCVYGLAVWRCHSIARP